MTLRMLWAELYFSHPAWILDVKVTFKMCAKILGQPTQKLFNMLMQKYTWKYVF